jgi:hypothetical protein
MLSGEATNTYFIVFGWTRSRLEPLVDCYDITEVLLKVALNTITLTPNPRGTQM